MQKITLKKLEEMKIYNKSFWNWWWGWNTKNDDDYDDNNECKIINDCDNENIYLDFHWKLYVTVDNNEPKKDKCEGNFLIILWFSWRKI